MEIALFRVKSYRTINREITIPLRGGACLIGPNNAGKSNCLRALQLFFTGYENKYGYTRDRDLTFGAGNVQTSLICTFVADPNNDADTAILDRYWHLHDMIGVARPIGRHDIAVHLYFTTSNNPIYRLFPNTRLPQGAGGADFSRRQKALVQDILSRFVVYYVPSNKSFEDLYQSLVLGFIREEVAAEIEPRLDAIRHRLADISQALTQTLAAVNGGALRVELRPPTGGLEELLTQFEFRLLDPQDTSVFAKGAGIQSAAMLAFLLWISRRNRHQSNETLWLLEEPESYLHPSLAKGVSELVKRLSEEATVVLTTHSLAFVSRTAERNVSLTRGPDGTQGAQFVTYREVTHTLRDTLGVEFSDFFALDLYNVFVEGESDKRYLEWYLDSRHRLGFDPLRVIGGKACLIMDHGGVGQIGAFLKANYVHMRSERPVVSLFDGDDAGTRELRALQNYFGQKAIPFEYNQHFVIVRNGFAIEGLFPDEWIIEHHDSHPNWYDSFTVDAHGSLTAFRIKDSHKSQVFRDLTQRADADTDPAWTVRWENVVGTIDQALADMGSTIYP